MAKKTKPATLEQARKRIRNVMEAGRKRSQALFDQAAQAADQVAKNRLIDRAHDALLKAADKIASARKQLQELGGRKSAKKREGRKKARAVKKK